MSGWTVWDMNSGNVVSSHATRDAARAARDGLRRANPSYRPGSFVVVRDMASSNLDALIAAITDSRYWDQLPKAIRDAAQPFLPTADDVRGILG